MLCETKYHFKSRVLQFKKKVRGKNIRIWVKISLKEMRQCIFKANCKIISNIILSFETVSLKKKTKNREEEKEVTNKDQTW